MGVVVVVAATSEGTTTTVGEEEEEDEDDDVPPISISILIRLLLPSSTMDEEAPFPLACFWCDADDREDQG
jgi:hypothetical protein